MNPAYELSDGQAKGRLDALVFQAVAHGIDSVDRELISMVLRDYLQLRREMEIREQRLCEDLRTEDADDLYLASTCLASEREFLEDCLRGKYREHDYEVRTARESGAA